MGLFGGAGQLSGFADLVEDTEHDHCGLRAALLAKSPDGFDLDIKHVRQYYELSFIYVRSIGTQYHIFYRKYPPTLKNKNWRKYDVYCTWLLTRAFARRSGCQGQAAVDRWPAGPVRLGTNIQVPESSDRRGHRDHRGR